MEAVLRKAKPEDREKAIWVESKSTPNLSYVPNVFEMFISDDIGEFSVVELEGEVVACGKYTVVPDGSAWLETLRVIPEKQGLGLGKRLYEHWLSKAQSQGVRTLRMYTTIENVRSKGLAERYGFKLAQTFKGATLSFKPIATSTSTGGFRSITDPEKAKTLMMHISTKWNDFLVMNRTFYKLTPALIRDMVAKRMVYENPETRSIVTLGARFMPEQSLHIGVFGSDSKASLDFAMQKGMERKVGNLSCIFPSSALDIQGSLVEYGFKLDKAEYIVMERNLD